jgi:anti-anti-sigma factor
MAASGAVEVVVDGEVTSVTVIGELDLALSEEFVAAACLGVGQVGINLAEVSFIDSSGVSALLRAMSALKTQGRAVRVVHPSAAARQVFAICGLEEHLGIAEPTRVPFLANDAPERARIISATTARASERIWVIATARRKSNTSRSLVDDRVVHGTEVQSPVPPFHAANPDGVTAVAACGAPVSWVFEDMGFGNRSQNCPACAAKVGEEPSIAQAGHADASA